MGGSTNNGPPIRKVSNQQRVELARQISTQLLETYQSAVLAVYICGSTAKKLDRPYSDLEMICVVRDGTEIPNRRYVHDGLLVDLGYHQESEYLKLARDTGWDWHLGADQFRNHILLFEHGNWMRKLGEAVTENDRADFTETIRVAAFAMTESLAAVRNADLKQDQLDLRTRAFYMAWDTGRVVFLLNKKYVLTTSWFWKQLFECKDQPKDFKKLISVVAGFAESSPRQLVEAAERLWQETMVLVREHGITIESSEIIV
jgi:kanamycin nucleotidyltransferase